ncbi:hypothetical protein QT972_25010, partial [Microcoleus sp. herbarium7]
GLSVVVEVVVAALSVVVDVAVTADVVEVVSGLSVVVEVVVAALSVVVEVVVTADVVEVVSGLSVVVDVAVTNLSVVVDVVVTADVVEVVSGLSVVVDVAVTNLSVVVDVVVTADVVEVVVAGLSAGAIAFSSIALPVIASLLTAGFSEVLPRGKIRVVEGDAVSNFVPVRVSVFAVLGELTCAKFRVYLMSPLICKTRMVYSPADKPSALIVSAVLSLLEELLMIAPA